MWQLYKNNFGFWANCYIRAKSVLKKGAFYVFLGGIFGCGGVFFYNPSVCFADSSPYTGEPLWESGAQGRQVVGGYSCAISLKVNCPRGKRSRPGPLHRGGFGGERRVRRVSIDRPNGWRVCPDFGDNSSCGRALLAPTN